MTPEVMFPIRRFRYPLARNHPCRAHRGRTAAARSFPCRGCPERELCRETEACWRSPLPARSVACLVVPASDVHPRERVDGLAQNNDVAGLPVGGSRRDADRRRHMGRGVASRLPVDARLPRRPGMGDTAAAADRGVAYLAVERRPFRREPVAQHVTDLRCAVTERELQTAVIECARLLGWRVAHFRPALTARGWRTPVEGDGAGFPDLVLARPGRLIFAELKSERGRVSDEQNAWLDALATPGVVRAVWFPRDWLSGAIEYVLRDAGIAAAPRAALPLPASPPVSPQPSTTKETR